jgi:hypothetical protein
MLDSTNRVRKSQNEKMIADHVIRHFDKSEKQFCDLLTYQNGLPIAILYCTLAITCVIRYDV